MSGEVLAGELVCGIDGQTIERIATQIRGVREIGVEVAVVIGGGNIFRGTLGGSPGVDRITGDCMGMLATIINALALQSCLEAQDVPSRVLSAIPVEGVAEPFVQRRAVDYLEKGRAVIFAGGTGHPYFTTDTAAALRALEIGAEAILKGTKVDGVYSADPFRDPQATQYERLSFMDVLEKGLRVVDTTAASLCMDNNLPLVVFNIQRQDALKRIILGEPLGTVVKGERHD